MPSMILFENQQVRAEKEKDQKAGKHFSSKDYWDRRYQEGGTSGAGSEAHSAEFKARFLNRIMQFGRYKESGGGESAMVKQPVKSVVELGVGDGQQLKTLACLEGSELASPSFTHYLGVDVSLTVVERTKKMLTSSCSPGGQECAESDDSTFPASVSSKIEILHESELLHRKQEEQQYDLALSQDVVYHLTEETVYDNYLRRLFSMARRFVVLYTRPPFSDQEAYAKHSRSFKAKHVLRRPDLENALRMIREDENFAGWTFVEEYRKRWDQKEKKAIPVDQIDKEKCVSEWCSVFYVFRRGSKV